jgi:hypothetical protein
VWSLISFRNWRKYSSPSAKGWITLTLEKFWNNPRSKFNRREKKVKQAKYDWIYYFPMSKVAA